jgi:hypothetical protein
LEGLKKLMVATLINAFALLDSQPGFIGSHKVDRRPLCRFSELDEHRYSLGARIWRKGICQHAPVHRLRLSIGIV